jgi:hypothetical protein
MIYSAEVLRDFVVTAHQAAGELTHPEAEPALRKALASQSAVRESARQTVNLTIGRWSPEQRVRIARALDSKGLPSLLDVLIAFDGKERRMLRAKKITDEAEYTIVKDILTGDDLTDRQRLKLNAMLRAYDDEVLRDPNSERARSRTRR